MNKSLKVDVYEKFTRNETFLEYGKWLRQRTHDQEVIGSNPNTVYWMGLIDAGYYIHKNNKNKGSRMGHTKTILKKKLFLNILQGTEIHVLLLQHKIPSALLQLLVSFYQLKKIF